MNPLKKCFALLDHGVRALAVRCLSKAAQVVRRVTVRLYVRRHLTGVEMRYLLGLSSTISRASVRLLRPPRK
ncbi:MULTISPECIES: hypothetical protein [Pseudomonas]|uniref:Uncharacterized protein n=1 Tax=Pseudomonas asplenii TaxID=53407 RepID=A0A0M9GCR9_9PSED|nr:hypothetical protein [Pseudomonas fuscovaginae]KPA87979.1 hypothetical protein PF66_05556 [Pseudomonas fuscovaginae]KPA94637.1 hypothetical protein PF70_05386 [Pseudomonas fuscovaginae]